MLLLLLQLPLLGYGMAWLAEEEEGWRRRATHYTLPIMYGTGGKVIDRQRERDARRLLLAWICQTLVVLIIIEIGCACAIGHTLAATDITDTDIE